VLCNGEKATRDAFYLSNHPVSSSFIHSFSASSGKLYEKDDDDGRVVSSIAKAAGRLFRRRSRKKSPRFLRLLFEEARVETQSRL
tara:strand:- start:1332 stop:1586 length:255 start_codon:yes stop_codon:yes gene_type:complete